MSKERPPHIIRAIEDGDTELLRRAGKKGALVANLIREWKATGKALNDASSELEYWKGVQAAGLDVVGIDGEDVDTEAIEDRILALELFIKTREGRKTVFPPEPKKRKRKVTSGRKKQTPTEDAAIERLPDSHLLKTQTKFDFEEES